MSIQELGEHKLLESQPATLERLGFGSVHVADETEDVVEMSSRAAVDALAERATSGPLQVRRHATATRARVDQRERARR